MQTKRIRTLETPTSDVSFIMVYGPAALQPLPRPGVYQRRAGCCVSQRLLAVPGLTAARRARIMLG
ncbi:MAG: hypothetical protein EA400_10660 [Chromatiaceae bacterium]|nr:MAG: hypothetical protein EA400_10660 [Chromatiaceae bacterium]